jgi:hypothetical protein
MSNQVYFETEQYAEIIGAVEFDIIATEDRHKPQYVYETIRFVPETLKFFGDDEDNHYRIDHSYTAPLPSEKQILADEIRENLMQKPERKYIGNFFHKSDFSKNLASCERLNLKNIDFFCDMAELSQRDFNEFCENFQDAFYGRLHKYSRNKQDVESDSMVDCYSMHFLGFITVSYEFSDILKSYENEGGGFGFASCPDGPPPFVSETRLLNPPAISSQIYVRFKTPFKIENIEDLYNPSHWTSMAFIDRKAKCVIQKNTPPENERKNFYSSFRTCPGWVAMYFDEFIGNNEQPRNINWIKENELNYYEKKALKEYENANIEFKRSVFFEKIKIFLEEIGQKNDIDFKLAESESIPTFTVSELDKEKILDIIGEGFWGFIEGCNGGNKKYFGDKFFYENTFKMEKGLYFRGQCPNENIKFPDIDNSIDNTNYFQIRIMQEGYND